MPEENEIFNLVGLVAVTCAAYGGCIGGLGYGGYQLSEYMDRCNNDIEVKIDSNSCNNGDNDDGGEDEEEITFEVLIEAHENKNKWCVKIKEDLSAASFLTNDLQTTVKDYVSSVGGEVIVKDGPTLYSLMVAPKGESGCDDSELSDKFVVRMMGLYPDAKNIELKSSREHDYIILKIEYGELVVNDALLYDLSKSTKL